MGERDSKRSGCRSSASDEKRKTAPAGHWGSVQCASLKKGRSAGCPQRFGRIAAFRPKRLSPNCPRIVGCLLRSVLRIARAISV